MRDPESGLSQIGLHHPCEARIVFDEQDACHESAIRPNGSRFAARLSDKPVNSKPDLFGEITL
jgi:hypothetical protein